MLHNFATMPCVSCVAVCHPVHDRLPVVLVAHRMPNCDPPCPINCSELLSVDDPAKTAEDGLFFTILGIVAISGAGGVSFGA